MSALTLPPPLRLTKGTVDDATLERRRPLVDPCELGDDGLTDEERESLVVVHMMGPSHSDLSKESRAKLNERRARRARMARS